MKENAQVNKQATEPTQVTPDPKASFEDLGSCKREECRCIHEHGLIPVKNADGSVSQFTKAQAQSMLDSLKSVEQSLNQAK